ncbi:MAG TPA: hypothetical protein VN521_01965, partial [Negativicutes bacterium]|nr:hypothetical protein [Negativicutes bacterium]
MKRPTMAPTGRRLPTENEADWVRPQRLLIIALMVLAVFGFFQAWAARVDRALLMAETELVDSHRSLQAMLSSAQAQLDLLKLHAELNLNDPAPRPPLPLADWLQPSPVLGVFAGVPPIPDAALGYVSMGAPLPAPGSERAR